MAYPYKGKFRISNAYNKPNHNGLDFVGIDDKHIYAVADGIVERADNKGELDPNGFGTYVRISVTGQSRPTYDYYGHLVKGSILVGVGAKVKAGDLLGTEGNTGKSSGNHLHFERRVGGYDRECAVNVADILGVPNVEGAIVGATEVILPNNSNKALVKQAEHKLTATKTVTEDKVKAETESLKKQGYDVVTVQVSKAEYADKLKPLSEIAKEVMQGKWGNGDERKKKLTQAGYDYAKVQAEVNKL